MTDLKVTELRKMNSKYDLVVKGQKLKLEVEPSGKGFLVLYVHDHSDDKELDQAQASMPAFIKNMTGMCIVSRRVVVLKRWQRWLGFSIEKKVIAAANEMRDQLEGKSPAQTEAARLRELLK